MSKKYQVFISSTFSDLIEERMAASQILLTLDCIPVGMEQFPASNMSQMEYIGRMLENCDYYILISAGRYGSLDTDGIGFTEKEYDYAIDHNIPVMTFIKKDIETLPAEKREETDAGKAKLYAFRDKIKAQKLVQFFTSKEELQAKICGSLYQCMKDYPAVGWIRASGKEMDAALEVKMEEYIKEHTYAGHYSEEDNPQGGVTVTINNTMNSSAQQVEEYRKDYLSLREKADYTLSFYANVFTNIIEVPNEEHEKASVALRDIGMQFKVFADKKRPDCPDVPPIEELREVSGEFIGLSNTMYVHKGGDKGRLLEDNIRREERIMKILEI